MVQGETESGLMDKLMQPGVALMRRFTMPVKLVALGMLLLIPTAVTTFQLFDNRIADTRLAYRELDGVRIVAAASQVVSLVQLHRGQNNLVLSGKTNLEAARSDTEGKLAQALGVLQTEISNAPELQLETRWKDLRPQLDAFTRSEAGQSREAAFAAHTAAVEKIRQLILFVGETSGLLLDPEAASYFLMAVQVEHLVPLAESVGLARGAGAALLARTDASAAEASATAVRAEWIKVQLERLSEMVAAYDRTGSPRVKGWDEVREACAAFVRSIEESFGGGSAKGNPDEFFAAGTKTIEAINRFRSGVADQLQTELNGRADRNIRMLTTIALVGSLALLVTIYLVACFFRSTVKGLENMRLVMRRGSSGNLADHVLVDGKDEIADISSEFEKMLVMLSSLVAEVRSASALVTHVGDMLVSDADELSHRTQLQANSLEQAARNVASISDDVTRNSDAANEVSMMTRSLHNEADQAGSLMAQTMTSMGPLQKTSDRMSDIIGVIDSIAFQTNLLALNAAVEAARAGEQGRGFAVVATEVRNLARRSQSAAGEVRALIAESAERVSTTVSDISKVNTLMESLVTGIREVAGSIESIAEVSARQSGALHSVVQAVGDLDKVTSENSGLVERTSHRSARLTERSRQLQEAVAHMHLREGTADEAFELVKKAVDHFKAVGFTQASKDFMDRKGSFLDRDLYIFGLDRAGVYQIMGANADKVGTNVNQAPGVDAAQLLADVWHRAEQGGGWVEYNIVNPVTGDIRGKASYVIPVSEDLVLGCGAYRSAIS